MNKTNLLIGFALTVSYLISGQNINYSGIYTGDKNDLIRPHKSENELWGLKNQKTGLYITPPIFERFYHSWGDTAFLAITPNKESTIINDKGQFLVPFAKTLYEIETFDSVYFGHIISIPYTFDQKINYRCFLVNNKNECIPANYFPCAYSLKKANNTISDALFYIQKAEEKRFFDEIDSAIVYCKLAIEANPTNPSLYYWGAELLLNNLQEGITYRNNKAYSTYYAWLEKCLNKADQLENRIYYRGKIKKLQYYLYSKNIKNRTRKKEIKIEYNALRKKLKQIYGITDI